MAQPYDASHPDQVIIVAYLFLAGVLLNLADVRLDRGHLTLGGIAMVATAILTNPLDATLVGLSIALGHSPRGVRAILANATIYGAIAVIATTVASLFHSTGGLPIGPRFLAALSVVFSVIGVAAVALSITSRKTIRVSRSTTSSPTSSLRLAYLSLAGVLMC